MTAALDRDIDRCLVDATLDVMQRRFGWVFPEGRTGEITRVVRKAWRVAGQPSTATFAALLETDPSLFDRLIDELAVGETYFFRETAHFDLIRREILPDFLARTGDKMLRAWSAGCASGEEPYSLAILFEQEALAHRATVFATDLSPSALRFAREARYRSWSLRGNDSDFVQRYFDKNGEYLHLAERIRGRVRYERHNLNSDVAPSFAENLDLILCRNVMIYFDTATVARVARLLFDALADGGWLLTAPADPMLTTYAPFATVKTPAGIIYRRLSLTKGQSQKEGAPGEGIDQAWPSAPGTRRIRIRMASPRTKAKVAHRLTRKTESAVETLTPAAVDADTEALRIRALADSGDFPTAFRTLDEALGRHPLHSGLHYLRAIISLGQGRDDEAVVALGHAIYLDRNLALAHFTLGLILRRRGDSQLAQRAFENAVTICEASSPTQVLAGGEGETVAMLVNAARAELKRVARS
ncbi:MAG TPA: CheR family methyltransferase [Magnetospirillaceae bacterium]|jgi:chemotaxis protein methyltransferase CheR